MNNYGEIIIYQTDDGLTKINVNMQEETVWLSLDQMAELFQRDLPYRDISRKFLKKASCSEIQLLQILQQLPQTGKYIT